MGLIFCQSTKQSIYCVSLKRHWQKIKRQTKSLETLFGWRPITSENQNTKQHESKIHLEFCQSLGGHEVQPPPHLFRVSVLGGFHDDVLVAQQGCLDVFDQQGLQGEGQVQADLGQLLTMLLSHFNTLCCCRQALLTVKHLMRTKKISLYYSFLGVFLQLRENKYTFTGFRMTKCNPLFPISEDFISCSRVSFANNYPLNLVNTFTR